MVEEKEESKAVSKLKAYAALITAVGGLLAAVPALVLVLQGISEQKTQSAVSQSAYTMVDAKATECANNLRVLEAKVRMLAVRVYGPDVVMALEVGSGAPMSTPAPPVTSVPEKPTAEDFAHAEPMGEPEERIPYQHILDLVKSRGTAIPPEELDE